ncbi:MAG: hypothetical protein ACOX4Y_06690 [Limnochordia bacterium]|jgi:iron complex transport system substrate-binding protein
MGKGRQLCQAALLVLLFLLLFPKALSDLPLPSDYLTDHGGRLVALPPIVQKIWATTEKGTFLVYALEPDSIIGWNRGLSPELEFAIQPQYRDLPTVGTWDETYQTMQAGTVLEQKPDLILHYAPADSANVALADEIQEILGIPALLLDSSVNALPDVLRLVGQLLGREVRGQALAAFVENQLAQFESFQRLQAGYAPIPVHIISSYEPGHFDELLELAGMIEMPQWNSQPPLPDFVLIMPHSVFDPYGDIERDGHRRIYQIPSFPCTWLEPGSIFSLLGLEWLHSIAYPSYGNDLPATYKAFMEVFFQLNITPELLEWTLRRSGISY